MRLTVLAIVFVVACGPQNNAADDDVGGDDGTAQVDASTGSTGDGKGSGSASGGPGSACSCDADCADDGGHAGVCIYGVCMTKASAECSAAGSQTECPTGSRCWNLTGHEGSLCWPDCAAHMCAGACASDGSCEPTAQTDCDPTCGEACSCTATSCGTGQSCVSGECVPDVGAGPGPGPGPTCASLPTRDCTSGCSTLTPFSPRTNTAYDDYPINGETTTNQYRSYPRKDLNMLVAWATAKTACKTAAWTAGNGGPLGLGDMSESNGAIPGTSIGQPGHPAGTHVDGYDMDVGYYQIGTPDNKLRPICNHVSGNQDMQHCVEDPVYLDVWRHALFLGNIFESSRTRVIGVDGKAGPKLVSAMNQLCNSGWLSTTACNNIVLAYETTDNGQGWYYFHHHHSHISLKHTTTLTDKAMMECDSPIGCNPTVRSIAKRPAGLHRVR